mmetsp:Transcript_46551/g.113361  ORF Transcript_46551/g.113361 Transcript_46551/m.113361 type:complete len:254 (+) Transcript_46551:3436-4197(+)
MRAVPDGRHQHRSFPIHNYASCQHERIRAKLFCHALSLVRFPHVVPGQSHPFVRVQRYAVQQDTIRRDHIARSEREHIANDNIMRRPPRLPPLSQNCGHDAFPLPIAEHAHAANLPVLICRLDKNMHHTCQACANASEPSETIHLITILIWPSLHPVPPDGSSHVVNLWKDDGAADPDWPLRASVPQQVPHIIACIEVASLALHNPQGSRYESASEEEDAGLLLALFRNEVHEPRTPQRQAIAQLVGPEQVPP